MTKSDVEARRYETSIAEHERRGRLIPGGVNSNVRLNSFPTPLTFERGHGPRLWDVDGNEYIDYAMGMGPHILGHAPDIVTQRVQKAVVHGQLFAGQVPQEVELAELIVDSIPWVDQVRFGQSGTEMDLLAVRVARAATGRQKVVRFVGHYHGWLDPLLVGPSESPNASFGLTPGQSRASAEDIISCRWNDIGELQRILDEHGAAIAAVIMEPMMCNTGVIPARPGYLEEAKRLCHANGSVFILDEVITGFRVGLTGEQGRTGVTADLTVYAKAVAAGYPLAVLGGRADLMSLIGPGGVNHSGTYNTGMLQMEAGLATVQHLRATDPYRRITDIGIALRDGINEAGREAAVDLVCEGPGPMLQLRFGPVDGVVDAASFAALSDSSRLEQLLRILQAKGVRTTSRGLMFLSAAHTDREVSETVEQVAKALEDMSAA